jgi:hypothetical protein
MPGHDEDVDVLRTFAPIPHLPRAHSSILSSPCINLPRTYPPRPNRPYNSLHEHDCPCPVRHSRADPCGDGALAAAKLPSEAGRAKGSAAKWEGGRGRPKKTEQLCCRSAELGPQSDARASPSWCTVRQLSCEPVPGPCGLAAPGRCCRKARAGRHGLGRSDAGAEKAAKSGLSRHVCRKRRGHQGKSRLPHQASKSGKKPAVRRP